MHGLSSLRGDNRVRIIPGAPLWQPEIGAMQFPPPKAEGPESSTGFEPFVVADPFPGRCDG